MMLLGITCAILASFCHVSPVQSAALSGDRPYHDEPFFTVDLDGVNQTADLTEADLKWNKSLISYRIMNFPARVPQSVIRSTVRRAFDSWSSVTNLDFVESGYGSAEVDIQLAFEGMNHLRRGLPCRYNYEATLAHAFFPEIGDVHFNTRHFFAEDTTVEQFLNTAIHEIGHSLGLLHSSSRSSIMYRAQTEELFSEPQPEDILAIQELYGVRSMAQPPPVTAPPQSTTQRPRTTTDLCSLPHYDAIVTDHRGNICVLAGRFYYNLNETNPPPRKISAKWPGLPPSVHAAFTYRDHKTYFYKADKYWKFDKLRMEANYPRAVVDHFPGIPNAMDAILLQKSGGFLAFKGQQYWFYDPSKLKPVDERSYPKPIEDLPGFPKRLDAALVTADGRRFIFSGLRYYEINAENKVVSRPKDVRREFFNC